MKVIQSFWSKPIVDYLSQDHHRMDWTCDYAKYKPLWLSWILNNHLLNKYYEVDLYTDSIGANFLVDVLGLKFKNVCRILDDFDYPSYLWALGKIRAIASQSIPFVHIDNDVFLFKPLPERLFENSFFVQNKEPIEEYYPIQEFESLNPCLTEDWSFYKQRDGTSAMNAGIIGGTDISFFKYYAYKVFELLKLNESLFREIVNEECSRKFMLIVEQYMLAACASKYGIKPYELLKSGHEGMTWQQSLSHMDNQANLLGYVHLWAKSKEDWDNVQSMEKLVQKVFPLVNERLKSIASRHLVDFFHDVTTGVYCGDRGDRTQTYILSDLYTGSELYSGVWNFTQSWARFVPQMKVLQSLPDRHGWNLASTVVIEFFMTWEKRVAVQMESILAQIPQHVKKIFIIHEINQHSRLCLEQADFLIYVTKYQEFVGNQIMGLNKPCKTIGALPRNENPVVNQGKPFIYVGGHFNPDKRGEFHLYDRVKGLIQQYRDEDFCVLIHPALRGHPATKEYTLRGFYSLMTDKECADRVVIYDEHCETYADMKQLLSMCRWCYLWRDDIAYDDLRKRFHQKDESLISERLGDSGMLRDAWESGCELIVESKARYATYFDGIKPITWCAFADLIEDVVECL